MGDRFRGCLPAGGRPGRAPAAARRAWQALLRRRPDEPGWGYNRLTPADADSTAWAAAAGRRLGVAAATTASPAARAFLAGTSWQAAASRRTPSATPSAATRACPRMRRSRAGRRPMPASPPPPHRCWARPPSTTWRASRPPTATGRATGGGTTSTRRRWPPRRTAARRRAVAWAQPRVGAERRRPQHDGEPSPWATAWCVRILRLGTPAEREARERAVAVARGRPATPTALAGVGAPACPAARRRSMPRPRRRRLDALDQRRVFTTAAVVAALARETEPGPCRSRPPSPSSRPSASRPDLQEQIAAWGPAATAADLRELARAGRASLLRGRAGGSVPPRLDHALAAPPGRPVSAPLARCPAQD